MPTEGKKEVKKTSDIDLNITPEEMAEAGLHLGHQTARTHPKMKPYMYGVKNKVHIFDLDKTAEKLTEALRFIDDIISQNKTLLLIGTKIQVKEILKESAEECGLPYINERWLGGTFTNFETIKRRIVHFKDLENQKKTGELEKYTKKERAKINKQLKDLETKFGGIKDMVRLPDAIFVMDMKKDILAVQEAMAKKIPVIAITDADVDPDFCDYPIPANDDAINSVKYILDKVKNVVVNAKSKVQSSKAK